MKTIFLDFDGVLCDSVKEAYLLARYAYFDIDVYKPIEQKLFEKFKKFRYLITNSWQYCLLIQTLQNENNTNSIEFTYNQLIKNGKTSLCEEFNTKFLAKRKDLMENDFDFWNSLEAPTSFLMKIKDEFKTKNYAILSTKNRIAIKAKLDFWNIEYNESLIFDKIDIENLTKGQFIEKYLTKNQIEEAILIDDSIENIQSCSCDKIIPLLTSWGYVSPKNNGLDEDKIIQILKGENV